MSRRDDLTSRGSRALRALLVEDNPGDARLIREELRADPRWPVALTHCGTLGDAVALLAESEPNVIVLDLGLPDSSGLETLAAVHGVAPGVPLLILTGVDDARTAEACIDAGAEDYLIKGDDYPGIAKTLHLTVRRSEARRQVQELQAGMTEILTNSRDAVLVVDEDGRTRFGNQAARSLFGDGFVEGELFGHAVEPGGVQEIEVVSADGGKVIVEMLVGETPWMGERAHILTFRDVTGRVEAKSEVDRLNAELRRALDEVKNLRGLLPICSYCKRIRDDSDYWHSVEEYVTDRTDAQFSHSICPTCMDEHFPEDD